MPLAIIAATFFILSSTGLYEHTIASQLQGKIAEAAVGFKRLAASEPRSRNSSASEYFASRSVLCFLAEGDFASAERELIFELRSAGEFDPLEGEKAQLLVAIEKGDYLSLLTRLDAVVSASQLPERAVLFKILHEQIRQARGEALFKQSISLDRVKRFDGATLSIVDLAHAILLVRNSPSTAFDSAIDVQVDCARPGPPDEPPNLPDNDRLASALELRLLQEGVIPTFSRVVQLGATLASGRCL